MKIKMKITAKQCLLFTVFFAATLFVMLANSPRVETLQAEVTIKDDGFLGFAADPGIANFGSVPRGNVGERAIILRNENEFPETIKFTAKGEIGPWISFQENNFVLGRNETKQVIVNVNVPNDAALGVHKGEIVTLMRRKWL